MGVSKDLREGVRASIEIIADSNDDLERMVGQDGEVLDALQELTRLAVGTPVDGYWRGLPGIEALKEESHALA